MKRFVLFLAALALMFGGVGQVKAGPITYNLDSYLSEQNGWSLSGTITTDGKLGPITGTDILSWEFTLTKGTTTVTHGLTLGGAIVDGTLLATATSLTLPIPTPGTQNALQLGNGFFDFPLIEWARGSGGSPISYPAGDWYHSRWQGFETFWTDNVPTGTLPLPTAGEPFIIAGPSATVATPEPSTLTLLSLGSLGLLGYGWRRRKQVA